MTARSCRFKSCFPHFTKTLPNQRLIKYALPKYRKHKASGNAVVSIGGKDHDLGPHGSETSRAEYDRLIADWIASGRPSTTRR